MTGESDFRQQPKSIPAPSPPTEDPVQAQKEERLIEQEKSEHRRDQFTRGLIAYCMWVLIVIVFAVICGSIVTLGWHLIFPKTSHWLSPEELQDVKNFILSGAIVGVGTSYIGRYLEPGDRRRSRQ